MLSERPLEGQIALITGASRGIGSAIATRVAEAGATVAIASRHPTDLDTTFETITAAEGRGLRVALDVSDASNVEVAFDTVTRELGPIDLLVNNAGVNIPRLALHASEAEWDTILDTNLKGAFLCAKAVAPSMIERSRGKIINISSAAGLVAVAERAAYCSSKAGLIMLTRVLALEWAPFGITVNAVAPTFVETELAAQTLDQPGMREHWTSEIPLGRLASIDDVAAAVLYLASPAANFITGISLPVDGGLTMR